MFGSGCCALTAEKWAASAWKKFNLELPVNLEWLSDWLKLEVLYLQMEDDVSGFLLSTELHNRVIINSTMPDERKRFTLAHEIAHACLQRCPCPRPKEWQFHLFGNDDGKDCQEGFCNEFAADLLMPRPLVIEHCKQLGHPDRQDKTRVLAARFGVSMHAMRIRLRELGLEYHVRSRYHESRERMSKAFI